METRFEKLAVSIFFGHAGLLDELLEKYCLMLKSGKTNNDVYKAFNKGWYAGRGKFEHEVACAGRELKKVLKEQA